MLRSFTASDPIASLTGLPVSATLTKIETPHCTSHWKWDSSQYLSVICICPPPVVIAKNPHCIFYPSLNHFYLSNFENVSKPNFLPCHSTHRISTINFIRHTNLQFQFDKRIHDFDVRIFCSIKRTTIFIQRQLDFHFAKHYCSWTNQLFRFLCKTSECNNFPMNQLYVQRLQLI